MANKPDYYDPSTWSDELVLMEYKMAMKSWTELMFHEEEDLIIKYTPERAIHMLGFWESRLDLAEPEARKRGLI